MKIERIVKTAGTPEQIASLELELSQGRYAHNNPYGAIINNALKTSVVEKLNELKKTTTMAVVQAGRLIYEFSVDGDVSDSEIKEEVKGAIREARQEARTVKTDTISFNGLKYNLVGGVFQQTGAVKEIKANTNGQSRAGMDKTPHPKIKDAFVGFEIEYISKVGGAETRKSFAENKLDGYVTCKGDGSLRADGDGESTHEVTVLCRQSEALAVMSKVLSVIKSHGGYVNQSCGGHIHLDARAYDPVKMYNNLVAGLPLLSKLIPQKRVGNKFCKINGEQGFQYYSVGEGSGSKYWAINPQTYSRIKTIEVRMHGGTLSLSKWINWLKICAALAYNQETLTRVSTLEEFAPLYKGPDKEDLLAFIEKRMSIISKLGAELDTRTDHFLDIYESIA